MPVHLQRYVQVPAELQAGFGRKFKLTSVQAMSRSTPEQFHAWGPLYADLSKHEASLDRILQQMVADDVGPATPLTDLAQ